MQRYRVVIMLVLFGVLPVVATFFVALSFLDKREGESTQAETTPAVEEAPSPEPLEAPEPRTVLAAARALPLGTLLGKDDLTLLELDPAAVGDDHIVVDGDPTDGPPSGYALREAIAGGAPITWSALVGPGERGFLAAVLRPGTRAVTIQVGRATGHAALIEPGDRVDVILSAELAVDGGDRRVLARTIAEDLRVVAINKRTDSPDGIYEEGELLPPAEITTATLEASHRQGNRLVLGEHEGTLWLAVRSLATAPASGEATADGAVDLREMLLSSSEFSASEDRERRTQELDDLSARTQLVESKMKLRAAMEEDASGQKVVRILRGNAPAEEVVFASH